MRSRTMPSGVREPGEAIRPQSRVMSQFEYPQWMAEGVRKAREVSRDALMAYVTSFNWVELPYVFRDGSGTGNEYSRLANLVAEAWRARLQCLYPVRRLTVRTLFPVKI